LTTATATQLTISALTNDVPYSNQVNTSMAADYLGFLGYSCFGNIHAANFFTPSSIANFSGQMPGFDASFNAIQVMPMIQESTTDELMNPLVDDVRTEVATQEQSLCYLLYKQLLQNAPERFTTADGGANCMRQPTSSGATPSNTWYLPIQNGDVLQCIVTMNSNDDQIDFGSSAGTTPVQGAVDAIVRKYLVRFVVGATSGPADGNTSGSETIHNNNPGLRL
jgi:hypothetical protein